MIFLFFLYTIGNVDFFLRFSPLMFLRKSKNRERQNKRAKGIKRQDRLGQLEINIGANAPTRANQPFCTLSCLVSAHSVVSYKMADMGENIPNGKGREKGYEQEKKGGWGKEVDGHGDSDVLRLKCSDSANTPSPPRTSPHPHTYRRSVTAVRKRRYNDF